MFHDVGSQLLQHLHHLLPFQDQVADAIVADAFFQLIAELQLIVLYRGLEVPEGDIGVLLQLFSNLVQMGGQDEQGLGDADQTLDDGGGAFHSVLHVGALEQLVDEH